MVNSEEAKFSINGMIGMITWERERVANLMNWLHQTKSSTLISSTEPILSIYLDFKLDSSGMGQSAPQLGAWTGLGEHLSLATSIGAWFNGRTHPSASWQINTSTAWFNGLRHFFSLYSPPYTPPYSRSSKNKHHNFSFLLYLSCSFLLFIAYH